MTSPEFPSGRPRPGPDDRSPTPSRPVPRHVSPPRRRPATVAALAFVAAAALSACATGPLSDPAAEVRAVAPAGVAADLRWLATDEARRQARADVQAALAQPLSRADAVRVALAHSPALQAVLADGAAASAQAAQSARWVNPVFTFERLVRGDGDARELDVNRMLTLPLADLLLRPLRARAAEERQQQGRLRLAAEVVRAAAEADRAWVRAVAAQQAQAYAEQVQAAAEAGGELARRMEAAGNFNRLQRAREQAFAGEARLHVLRARQEAVATREALVRALGLDAAQAAALRLPDRLPELPEPAAVAAAADERAALQSALPARLDVSLARAQLDAEARRAGLTRVSSMVDGLTLGLERNGQRGAPLQRGFQVELPLPLFDIGGAASAESQARALAALHRAADTAVRAASRLRESQSAYRTAYDLARHYRDELVPLQQAIADENLLRYNGMLIGVFELLADAREQVVVVSAALDAQRDFWLADAALRAEQVGVPLDAGGSGGAAAMAAGGEGG